MQFLTSIIFSPGPHSVVCLAPLVSPDAEYVHVSGGCFAKFLVNFHNFRVYPINLGTLVHGRGVEGSVESDAFWWLDQGADTHGVHLQPKLEVFVVVGVLVDEGLEAVEILNDVLHGMALQDIIDAYTEDGIDGRWVVFIVYLEGPDAVLDCPADYRLHIDVEGRVPLVILPEVYHCGGREDNVSSDWRPSPMSRPAHLAEVESLSPVMQSHHPVMLRADVVVLHSSVGASRANVAVGVRGPGWWWHCPGGRWPD